MSAKRASAELSAAKDATAAVVRKLEEGRRNLVEKKKQWQRAVSALPPMEDLRELAARTVQRTAATFIGNYGSTILNSVASEAGGDRAHGGVPLARIVERDPFGFLCAGDPEGVAKSVAFILKLVPHYEPGPSLRERDKVVAALLDEITKLEQEDEALADELIAAGIAVQHRPEVVARRAEAAARADAKRRSVENRAERQARLDEAARETGVQPVRLG
jgi:hypothetical protein